MPGPALVLPHLRPELRVVPVEDPAAMERLWEFARSKIVLSQRHPDFIMRRMLNMSKGLVMSTDDDANMRMAVGLRNRQLIDRQGLTKII